MSGEDKFMEAWQKDFERVVRAVKKERLRQDQNWGQQNHTPETWCLILGEEVGEVQKAVLEHRFGDKPWSEYREELVQVAAVAVAMIESFDRNEGRP